MSEAKPGFVQRLLTNMQHAYSSARANSAPAPRTEPSIHNLSWGGITWDEFLRGGAGAGVLAVSEDSVRAVSAVIACCNLIGGAMACMPLHFYRSTVEGRDRYTPNEWWLFNERPHPGWSASTFWEFLSTSRLLHGDAFAVIERASPFDPRITSIEPWHPLLVDVLLVDGRRKYRFHPQYGNGEQAFVRDQDDVLHIPGPGFNGLRSMSQLRYGLRTAAGIAQAADKQAADWFGNGARPDFAIEVPGDMSPESQMTLRETWRERHSGPLADKVPVVLAGGMKLHQLTMSAEDMQLITTRKFQVEEIARIFGVPPHMIGSTDKSTSWGSGIAEQGIGFAKYTMGRHLKAFEDEINYKLFKTARNFVEFLTAGLERGNLQSRNTSYRIALGRAGEPGWMTINEVRALENMPPIEGGDALNDGAGTPAAEPDQDDAGQDPPAKEPATDPGEGENA